MLQFFSHWYKQYFSDQEAVLLMVVLVVGFTILITMGTVLAPVLTAIVLSYLLQGLLKHGVALLNAIQDVFLDKTVTIA